MCDRNCLDYKRTVNRVLHFVAIENLSSVKLYKTIPNKKIMRIIRNLCTFNIHVNIYKHNETVKK